MTMFTGVREASSQKDSFVQPKFTSQNSAEGAKVVFETLKESEEADAANILDDSNSCWTAQSPHGSPAEGVGNTISSYVETELAQESTINTALIEEIGNQVQYFRLQALVDGEWKTVYQSEKIQDMRLCSFDAVTTNRIRLSIDKFRDDAVPASIRSLKLYNEPQRAQTFLRWRLIRDSTEMFRQRFSLRARNMSKITLSSTMYTAPL